MEMASTNLSKKEYGCKGDPRMHRAVALKLANPDLTLYEALVMGGFQYASDDRNSTDGIDQVTLRQRKNNLSRRVRQAQELQRNNQQRFLELHKQPLGRIGPVLTSRIGSIPLEKTADNDNNWASSDKIIFPESFSAEDPIALEESCVATQQHQFKSLRSQNAFMGPLEKKPFLSRYYEQMGQRIPSASQKSVTDFLGASLAVEKGSLDISQCDFEPLSFPGPDEFAPSLDFKKEPCLPQPPFKTDHDLKRNASELGRAEEAKQGIKRACVANNGKDSLHHTFLSGSFSFLGDLEPVPMGAAAPVASKDEPKQERDDAKRAPFDGSNEPFLPSFQATSLSEDIFSTLIHDLKAFADQKPLSASKMEDSRMEKAKALFSVEMNALYERCMLLAGYSQEEIRDTSQEKLIFARYAWELEGKRLRETIGRWLANNAQTTPTANKVLQSNQRKKLDD